MSQGSDDDIDFSVTTWEGSRRAQLRRARAMTLRERMEALDGLTEIAEWFEEMRRQRKSRTAMSTSAQTGEPRAVQETKAADGGELE